MSRDAILGRIREALSVKTDAHVREVAKQSSHSLPVLANGPDGRTQAVKEFLPFVGESLEDHIAAFNVLSDKLQTEFIVVPTIDSARQTLDQLRQKHQWERVGIHDHELVQSCVDQLPVEFLNTSSNYDAHELEKCDVGISGCDALIAQTASALVTNHSAGGRALSVLPPHHVVVADASQMVTTMADGFAMIREKHHEKWPSFISFITGPSRTADIERVLVLGAHGPKKLTIIMISE
ncbi:MAG: lactate utilization protein [Mariniblastus sp.]|nr:lactate utilization protein [Mariniblastus sp.]MDG2180214.1 lactate utilization protein [Mariniblastus sp.]